MYEGSSGSTSFLTFGMISVFSSKPSSACVVDLIAFLWPLRTLIIFLCAYWSLTYLLLRNIWPHLLPTFKIESFVFFVFCFFLRKISPELTTTNPPFFAEEDWPWANVHAHLPLLYAWDTYHSMAFAKWCHIRTWDPNQRTPGCQEGEHVNLTAAPPGWPWSFVFLLLR